MVSSYSITQKVVMNIAKLKVSFVIPSLNEEQMIGKTIDHIKLYTPDSLDYEIIVADNGSTDKTIEIIKGKDVSFFINKTKTIADLRNSGTKMASGDILIFIDADVFLTKKWQINIGKVLESLATQPNQVTGSRCVIEDDNNWILNHWFKHMQTQQGGYINSGHLITSKYLFNKIGGFSKDLETAEDWDFSEKAKKAGAKIIDNKHLVATHSGYPKNLKTFIRREKWHGKGDMRSWSAFGSSKTAIAAFIHLLIGFISIVWSIHSANVLPLIFYLLVALLMSLIISVLKFGFLSPIGQIKTSILSYCYILGRSLSVLERIKSIIVKLIF